MKSTMIVFLLGFMMNGIFSPGVRANPERKIPGREVEQPGNTSQKLNTEVAQTGKSEDEVETEPIDVTAVRESFKLQVPLNYVGKFSSLDPKQKAVEIDVTISPVKPARRKGA